MCLAVPAKVEELKTGGRAIVRIGGLDTEISTELLEEVKVGDYVIVHVGFALHRLDPEEAEATLALLREMAEAAVETEP